MSVFLPIGHVESPVKDRTDHDWGATPLCPPWVDALMADYF